MKKNDAMLLMVAVFIGVVVCVGVITRVQTQAIQHQKQMLRAQQARTQQASAERKARLVQKINRYWQLREEAAEQGINTSQFSDMPFVVGSDGNIYRLLADGRQQRVPDDQFHDPPNPTAAEGEPISH